MIPILTFVNFSVRYSDFVLFINCKFWMHLMQRIVQCWMILLGTLTTSSRVNWWGEPMFVDFAGDKFLTDLHAPILIPNGHFTRIVTKSLHQLGPFALTESLLQVYLLLWGVALAATLHALVDTRLKWTLLLLEVAQIKSVPLFFGLGNSLILLLQHHYSFFMRRLTILQPKRSNFDRAWLYLCLRGHIPTHRTRGVHTALIILRLFHTQSKVFFCRFVYGN